MLRDVLDAARHDPSPKPRSSGFKLRRKTAKDINTLELVQSHGYSPVEEYTFYLDFDYGLPRRHS